MFFLFQVRFSWVKGGFMIPCGFFGLFIVPGWLFMIPGVFMVIHGSRLVFMVIYGSRSVFQVSLFSR